MEEILTLDAGLESSLSPDNSRLSVKYTVPGTGSYETFFTPGKFTPFTHTEIIIGSGFQRANPPGRGLGTMFYSSLSKVFSELASQTQETIVHPVFPTSPKSQAFFVKQGYMPDTTETWHNRNDNGDPWYYKVYLPQASAKLDKPESQLVELFKKLLPVRQLA